jgi:hypothetical protein
MGQAELNRQKKNAKTGLPGQGLPGQDCQDRTVGAGLPEQGCQNEAARTGLLG